MYKLIFNTLNNKIDCVGTNTSSIPFVSANMDYQRFKKDLVNGVELNDVDGNPITGDALKTFLATLP